MFVPREEPSPAGRILAQTRPASTLRCRAVSIPNVFFPPTPHLHTNVNASYFGSVATAAASAPR